MDHEGVTWRTEKLRPMYDKQTGLVLLGHGREGDIWYDPKTGEYHHDCGDFKCPCQWR